MLRKLIVGSLVLAMISLIALSTIGVTAPIIQSDYTIIMTKISPGPDGEGWNNVTNGNKINVSVGIRNQFRTMSGNCIMLQVNESVELLLNETEENPAGPIMTQLRAVNQFMQIELNCTCEMNATLSREFTFAELGELKGNVLEFRWAFFNISTNEWQYALLNKVQATLGGYNISCETDHFSTWTIIAPGPNPNPGTPFSAGNGAPFNMSAGNQYQVKTQSGFALALEFNASVEMTITEDDTNQYQNKIQAQHKVRTMFMNIALNSTDVAINATLEREFTNSELSQLKITNMTQLRFTYYDEVSGQWKIPENQTIVGNKISCKTNHFSTWSIVEVEEPVDTEDSDSIPKTGVIGFEFLALLALVPVVIVFRNHKSKEV